MSTHLRRLLPMFLALAVVAAACGNGDDDDDVGSGPSTDAPTFAQGTTMDRIQKAGKLVVGTKFDQPGLGQKRAVTGDVEGFDVEIAKLIAVGIFGGTVDQLGNKIEFVEATTPNREAFIENGTVDIVVATYTINDRRKERVAFAGPYYIAGQDILVKQSNNSIKTVNDLTGKKVCSVRNSTPAANLERVVPGASLTLFDTYSLCVEALRDGRVEAVSTDNSILLGFIDQNPGEFKITGNKFTDEPYGIGLKRDDTAFRSFINDRLEAIYANGQWAAAFERTLGKFGVPTPKPPAVNRYT